MSRDVSPGAAVLTRRPTPGTTVAPLVWSLPIAALVTVASVLGLVDPGAYEQETENWATQAKGQDLGNLLAVATLLVSGHRSAKGSYRAAVVWLGTLLYLVYAYVVYAMAVHFSELFLVYVAVLGLCTYAVIFSVSRIRTLADSAGRHSESRLPGSTSIATGVLFGGLWLTELVPATFSGEVPPSVVEAGLWANPIHVIDLAVVLPAFVIAGSLALRGDLAGLFLVGPLLVFSVLMGTSIVAAMALMAVESLGDPLVPLVLVSAVVVVSAVAARTHLREACDPPRA